MYDINWHETCYVGGMDMNINECGFKWSLNGDQSVITYVDMKKWVPLGPSVIG